MGLSKHLSRWRSEFKKWRPRRRRFPKVQWCRTRDRLPSPLRRRTMYVIGDRGAPKWAVFTCPCDAGHDIQLNLDDAHAPMWELFEGTRMRPSLRPSIDSRTMHGRCHFWITDGQVGWTRDSD